MLTLLGSLLGFIGAAVPEFVKWLNKRQDNLHELAMLDKQMEAQKLLGAQKLEEINSQADIAEVQTIYKTYTTKIQWVDALNGTVRPVLAYSFFALYAYAKWRIANATPWLLWTEDDMLIFSSVVCFYFGGRQFSRMRDKGHA